MKEKNPEIKFALRNIMNANHISINNLFSALGEGSMSKPTLYSYYRENDPASPSDENLALITDALRLLTGKPVTPNDLFIYKQGEFLNEIDTIDKLLDTWQYDSAIKLIEPQLKKIRGQASLASLKEGLLSNRLGRCLHLLGNWEEANDAYMVAERNLVDYHVQHAVAGAGRATALKELNPRKAQEVFQGVLTRIDDVLQNKMDLTTDESTASIDEKLIEANCLRGIGECLYLQGNLWDAGAYMELALNVLSNQNDMRSRSLRAHIKNDLARTYYSLDNTSAAIKLYEETLASYQKHNNLLGESFSKSYYAQALIKSTREQDAISRTGTLAKVNIYLKEALGFYRRHNIFGARVQCEHFIQVCNKQQALFQIDENLKNLYQESINFESIDENSKSLYQESVSLRSNDKSLSPLNKSSILEPFENLRLVLYRFQLLKTKLHFGPLASDEELQTEVPINDLRHSRPIAISCLEKGKVRFEMIRIILKTELFLVQLSGKNQKVDKKKIPFTEIDSFSSEFARNKAYIDHFKTQLENSKLDHEGSFTSQVGELEEKLTKKNKNRAKAFKNERDLKLNFITAIQHDLNDVYKSFQHAEKIAETIADNRTLLHAKILLVRLDIFKLKNSQDVTASELERAQKAGKELKDHYQKIQDIKITLQEIKNKIDASNNSIRNDRNFGYYYLCEAVIDLELAKITDSKRIRRDALSNSIHNLENALSVFNVINYPKIKALIYEYMGNVREIQENSSHRVILNYFSMSLGILENQQIEITKQLELKAKIDNLRKSKEISVTDQEL